MSTHEQSVLGAALLGPSGHPGILLLADEDFADRRHRVIAACMRDMIRGERHLDMITLSDELAARGKLSSPGGAGGLSYIHDLLTLAPPAATAEYYANAVRQDARVRIAAQAAARFGQLLAAEEAVGDLDAILATHRDAMDAIPAALSDDLEHLPTLAHLMSTVDIADDWQIPGLLARGDRVVITGAEGGGKSSLFRMLATCFAGGLNPWNGVRVADGMRVLYVDAEISTRQNRRSYSWIIRPIRRRLMDPGWEDRIFHYVRNDGLDLPGRDLEWFHHIAAKTSPDVIFVGPAYKCMRGDEKSDVDVLALLRVLDEVRVKHDASLFVEAHSPHGIDEDSRAGRPRGSSVWMGWPEGGFGFKRDKDQTVVQLPTPDHLRIVEWRGFREPRDWPDLVRWGDRTKGEFPWVPTRPDWRPSIDLGYSINKELT